MSAKPEQAQAPPTVADTGHHQMQQHQTNNYHQGPVIYQQPYGHVQHYQQQGPPVWNQPPQAAVHYVQYAPPSQADVYPEHKNQRFHNPYETMHYPPIGNGQPNGDMMMRGPPQPNTYGSQQYQQQWYPQAQQNQGQFIPTYATTFNVANDPTYHPNHPMNRPGGARQEDFQGGNDSEVAGYMQFAPFVPPMGAMESQAHASASYTANWVSSTSSIPPEMKDEPESDNISQYDSQRPPSHLNGDWTDHEDHMSPSTTQQSFPIPPPPPRPMPYVEKPKSTSQSTTKTKSAKGERTEEKRELTFDERLEKARMQKTRAENKGVNGESSGNLSSGIHHGSATSPMSGTNPRMYGMRRDHQRNDGAFNNNRGRGHFKENYNNGAAGGVQYQRMHQPPQCYQQQQQHNNAPQQRVQYTKRECYDNNTHNSSYNQPRNHQDQGNRQPNYRGRGAPRGGYRGGYQGGSSPIQFNQNPPNVMDLTMSPNITNALQNTHISNLPPGMAPGVPLVPIPYGVPPQAQFKQDVKFHNTWLDASSCPMPLASVVAMDTRFGRGGFVPSYRGRGGFGNRGGYRGGYSSPRYTPRNVNEPVVTPQKVTEASEPSEPQKPEVEPEISPPEDKEEMEEIVEVEKEEETKTEDKENLKAENQNEKEDTVEKKTSEIIPEVVISEPSENKDEVVVEKSDEKKKDEKELESL